MTNALVTIDATIPMQFIEVDDVLDNPFWKFCTDDPDMDTATYDEFDMGPDYILPAGTTVRIEHLWGHVDVGAELTKPTDYQVVLPKAATVKRVVHVLMSHYHAAVNQIDASARFLYIEQVSEKNGVVEVVWGT